MRTRIFVSIKVFLLDKFYQGIQMEWSKNADCKRYIKRKIGLCRTDLSFKLLWDIYLEQIVLYSTFFHVAFATLLPWFFCLCANG